MPCFCPNNTFQSDFKQTSQCVLDCRCDEQPSRKAKKKTKGYKPPQTPPGMKRVVYEPCVHLHFKPEHIDRDCLTREQYYDMLATPKGYPWLGEADCQNPELEIKSKSKKKKKQKKAEQEECPTRADAGDFADEFVEDMWDVMSPEITCRLIDFLVNEFGMSVEEAEDFIDCKSCVGKQTICKKKKSKTSIGLGPKYKWVKEFSDVFSKRIEQYIVNMLLTRRTPRTKRIAEKILECLCDLTGEKTTLQNPKTKIQKIMVLISDRLALWIDDMMNDIDKPHKKRVSITEEESAEETEEEAEEEGEEEEEAVAEEKEPQKDEEPKERAKTPEKEEEKKEQEEEKTEEQEKDKTEEQEKDKTEEATPEKEEEKEPEPVEKEAEKEQEQPEPEKEEPQPTQAQKDEEPPQQVEKEEEKPEQPPPEESTPTPTEDKTEEPAEEKTDTQPEAEDETKPVQEDTPPLEEDTKPAEEAEEVPPVEKEEVPDETKEDQQETPSDEGETQEQPPTEEEQIIAEEEKPTEEEPAETPQEEEKLPEEEIVEEKPLEEPEAVKEEVKKEQEKKPYGDVLDLVKEDIEGTPKDRRTDRQKADKDEVIRRIEKHLAGKDLDIQSDDIDDAASRVAHWMEHVLGTTEPTGGVRRKNPSPAYAVNLKTGSTLEIHKLSSGTVAQKTANARGVPVPPRERKVPETTSPMNLQSTQEWFDWANSIGNVADEWGKWLESKLTDAEKQIAEKKKAGPDFDFKEWREQAQTEAHKWRVEKEKIKGEGNLWNKKIDKKLKDQPETEVRSLDM